MSDLFDEAFEGLIINEGGYSDHPYDPGGRTCWGITENLARDAGYTGHMQDMPLETAKAIYREHYWHSYFDQMDFRVAFNVFDACVNHGTKRGVKMLQMAVGVPVDGIIGPRTMTAVAEKGWEKTIIQLAAIRLGFYTDLKTWPQFGRGWVRRIARNLARDGATG